MNKSNAKKKDQLGLSFGTAANRLRKLVLFELIKETSKDLCYRCSEKITCPNTLSIEHKYPWMDSEDPIKLFFDLSNIAFSHLSCNVKSRRIPNKRFFTKEERLAHSRPKKAEYMRNRYSTERRRVKKEQTGW